MAEDDPRVIEEQNSNDAQRWGRNHKGAKILANFYSRGEFYTRKKAPVKALITIRLQ